MACFDNVVALKELCDEQETFSGIYLNDIGITRSFIESVITSDYEGLDDFVTSKTTHAINVIKNAVHGRYGGKVNSSTLIHDHRLGYTQANLTDQTGSGWKGIQITLNNFSNYINMELSSLSLHVNTNGTVNILIYDLFQNTLLYTIPVTAVSGQIVTVYPHKVIESSGRPLNLFIGYNATGITSKTTYIRENQCCGISSCTTSFMTAKGVTNTTGTFIDEDLTAINHTAGLSLVYSLNCDPYAWMCSYARVLALPIAYKIGSEMYLHAIMNAVNNRSSNNTNLNVELMQQTQLFYENQYKDQLDAVLHNMHVPADSVCFQCKSPAQTAIVLP